MSAFDCHANETEGNTLPKYQEFLTCNTYLPPANEVCEGYVFTGVCDSVNRGGVRGCSRGACVVLFGGGHAWFYLGGMHGFIWGGVHGFIRGACMVLFGGHAWFYLGGHAWFYLGGVRGFIGGHACFYSGGVRGFIGGACMVLFRGYAWLYPGGACVVFPVFRIQ